MVSSGCKALARQVTEISGQADTLLSKEQHLPRPGAKLHPSLPTGASPHATRPHHHSRTASSSDSAPNERALVKPRFRRIFAASGTPRLCLDAKGHAPTWAVLRWGCNSGSRAVCRDMGSMLLHAV